jgi:hypothetical protein
MYSGLLASTMADGAKLTARLTDRTVARTALVRCPAVGVCLLRGEG